MSVTKKLHTKSSISALTRLVVCWKQPNEFFSMINADAYATVAFVSYVIAFPKGFIGIALILTHYTQKRNYCTI